MSDNDKRQFQDGQRQHNRLMEAMDKFAPEGTVKTETILRDKDGQPIIRLISWKTIEALGTKHENREIAKA